MGLEKVPPEHRDRERGHEPEHEHELAAAAVPAAPDAYWFLNAALDATATVTLAAGLVCVEAVPYTAGAPNQDSVALLSLPDGGAVLALADGMGGGPAGEAASACAVRAVVDAVAAAVAAGHGPRVGVLDGFEAAQAAVLALASGAATTLLVAEIQHGAVRTYHAGDSAACVFGRGGKLKLQTDFHSPVGYAQKSGLLDEHEALLHEERHYVSNLIGAPDMSVQVGSPLPLARYDTLVLGSDGLFDNLSIGEIGELVRRGPLPRAARALRDAVLARMHPPAGAGQTGPARAPLPSKPDDLALLLLRPGLARPGLAGPGLAGPGLAGPGR